MTDKKEQTITDSFKVPIKVGTHVTWNTGRSQTQGTSLSGIVVYVHKERYNNDIVVRYINGLAIVNPFLSAVIKGDTGFRIIPQRKTIMDRDKKPIRIGSTILIPGDGIIDKGKVVYILANDDWPWEHLVYLEKGKNGEFDELKTKNHSEDVIRQ